MADTWGVDHGGGVIRIERDPAFWVGIASHPEVAGALLGQPAELIGRLISDPKVLPLAAEHGGFVFTQLDAFGFVRELHTLFTEEGWGREVHAAGKEALQSVFSGPCSVVTTYQMRDNPPSQPPRSFGFVATADFVATDLGDARSWLLTKAAWLASPARRRMH